jgi:hypothetical protein
VAPLRRFASQGLRTALACGLRISLGEADKPVGANNNGLHKGWLKDHDNNGLHKGWLKDHDYNTSNDNNGNPVRAVPEPGSLLLLATGIGAIVWTLRKKR